MINVTPKVNNIVNKILTFLLAKISGMCRNKILNIYWDIDVNIEIIINLFASKNERLLDFKI